MSIAILGWGSLVWCPGSLQIRTRWRSDGPLLPIEFARISRDGRLTLVIQPGSATQATYWALSDLTTLANAHKNVRGREDCSSGDIHYIARDGSLDSRNVPPDIANRVGEWMVLHEGIQAVVWTGLASNWGAKRGREFTSEDAVEYLLQLEADRARDKATYDRAREYVTNAPAAIDTAVRRAMRTRGWEDTPLSPMLFEEAPGGA